MVLDGVTLHYPDRARPALDDVSVRIGAGEHLALTGPSGAGKSSVLALLLGFTAPTSGRVLVDGVDLADTNLAEWRRRLAWVPQRPHLFAGSIADNIRLADPTADDGAVRAAADAAGVMDFAAALPDGLDSEIGERGLRLSSGQRQRVGIARALLREAPVVLLDEPTAHLDEAGAAQLRTTMKGLCAGRTLVVVSHTHGWGDDADRVLRFAAGRLLTPEAVLAS